MNITLICLPFAGGSKYSLNFLNKSMPKNISCFLLDYPGHGTRPDERLAETIPEMVDDAYASVKHLLDKPFAIYGHSMGALVGFLLAKKIQSSGEAPPIQLIVSGARAPNVPRRDDPKYLLPKEEFITAVQKLGGLPDEILDNKELLEYFEPIIRSDFKAIEIYKYAEQDLLDIPIAVITGDKEELTSNEIAEWQSVTRKPASFYQFPGNHFFIYKYEKEIASLIASKLMDHVSVC